MPKWRVTPLGAEALHVVPEGRLTERARASLRALGLAVRQARGSLWLDALEAPRSLTVHYRAAALPPGEDPMTWLSAQLELLTLGTSAIATSRHHQIPVCFDPEFAPDLPEVAAAVGLSPESVIELIEKSTLTVASLGFLPGFAYLEGLPSVLHVPRRDTPRVAVPAGSLAIAAGYAGVYPLTSPGGWHLLGRTLCPMLDFTRPEVARVAAGDTISFVAISRADYEKERATHGA